MRKTIFAIALFFITSTLVNAQKNGGYAKGDKLLNFGLGLNSYYTKGIPIGASFEKGISDVVSIGINFDYLSNKYKYSDGTFDQYIAMYIGIRGSYHFNTALNIDDENIDLYGGATLGYRNFSWKNNYGYVNLSGLYGSGIYLGAFIGGKYYFNKKTAAFLEAGAIGSTNARVGIAFKF